MKRTVQALTGVLVVAVALAFGATPAMSGDDFCPMGGALIKAEVDKDKALAWGKAREKAVIAGEDSDEWSVLVLSTVDRDIAILLKPDSVFFGVAGKGGKEVDARDAERVFGNGLRKLGEAVKKGMTDLWKDNVVKIEGRDVQPLSDAAGLGTLEKDGDWVLKTTDCTGVDLDASELK